MSLPKESNENRFIEKKTIDMTKKTRKKNTREMEMCHYFYYIGAFDAIDKYKNTELLPFKKRYADFLESQKENLRIKKRVVKTTKKTSA